jgi:hypothetical protein
MWLSQKKVVVSADFTAIEKAMYFEADAHICHLDDQDGLGKIFPHMFALCRTDANVMSFLLVL